MKTLQNNYTTTEQSKRLLELGVPADSADCYIDPLIKDKKPWAYIRHDESFWIGGEAIPCWSVGRLMEIYDMCFIYPKSRSSWCAHTRVTGVLFVDYILGCYKNAIADKLLDFSKLED